MRKLRSFIIKDLNMAVLFGVTIGILLFMAIVLGDRIYNVRNLSSMALQIPEFAVLALGMGVVMLLGGIDLSIVSNASLAGILAAYVLTSDALPQGMVIPLAIIVALVAGVTGGLINGQLVTRFSINPIVATIGTMIFYQGIGMALTRGTAVTNFPSAFTSFGTGMQVNNTIPNLFIILAIISVVLLFTMNLTSFGKKVYLIGENHTASRFSAISNERIVTSAYTIAGLMAGISGLMIITRTNSARVGFGDTYLLQAILVCVLAGISPSGGKGKMAGILLALLNIQVLQSAFTLWQFTPFVRQIIWGVMLLALLFVNKVADTLSSNRQRNELLKAIELQKEEQVGEES